MILFDTYVILSLILGSFLHYLTPRNFKGSFLFALSFCIAVYAHNLYSFVLLLLGGLVYYVAKNSKQEKKKIQVVAVTILIVIAQLLYFKYFFSSMAQGLDRFTFLDLVNPIGVSYVSFRLISYLIDTVRENISEHKASDFLSYVFFFPIFPAGPIETFNNYNETTILNREFYAKGLLRLIMGYVKKIFLVDLLLYSQVSSYFEIISKNNFSDALSSEDVVTYLIFSLIYAWLDLSSYADIAIGYGRLFGKDICENMNFPLFRRNLSEYWNNWHMSLSRWCRNYVYFPVLGKTRNTHISLAASFIVMGLWHDVSPKWFVWGLWHALGITIYSISNRRWKKYKKKKKIKTKKALMRLGHLIGTFVTIMYSALGFSFIMMPDLGKAVRLLWEIFQ